MQLSLAAVSLFAAAIAAASAVPLAHGSVDSTRLPDHSNIPQHHTALSRLSELAENDETLQKRAGLSGLTVESASRSMEAVVNMPHTTSLGASSQMLSGAAVEEHAHVERPSSVDFERVDRQKSTESSGIKSPVKGSPKGRRTSSSIQTGIQILRAHETEAQMRARMIWDHAQILQTRFGRKADLQSAVQADQFARFSRKAREAGLAYYRQKWPSAPLPQSEVNYDEARKAFNAIQWKIKRAQARKDTRRIPVLLRQLDDAERRFVAARLDPEQEAADIEYKATKATKLKRSRLGRDTETQAIDSVLPPTSAAPSTHQPSEAHNSFANSGSTILAHQPETVQHDEPGSPTLYALLADHDAPDLTWL